MADTKDNVLVQIEMDGNAQQGMQQIGRSRAASEVVDIEQLKHQLPVMIVAAEFESKLEAAKIAYPEIKRQQQAQASLRDDFAVMLAKINLKNMELSSVSNVFRNIESAAKQQIASGVGVFSKGSTPEERATAQAILATLIELVVISESGPNIATKVMDKFVTNARGALEAELRGPLEATIKQELQKSFDLAMELKNKVISELKTENLRLEKLLFEAETRLNSFQQPQGGDAQKVDPTIALNEKLAAIEKERDELREKNHQQEVEIAGLKSQLKAQEAVSDEKLKSKDKEIALTKEFAEKTDANLKEWVRESLGPTRHSSVMGTRPFAVAKNLVSSQQAGGFFASAYKITPNAELAKAFSEPRAKVLTRLGELLKGGEQRVKPFYDMIRNNKEQPMADMQFGELAEILGAANKGLMDLIRAEDQGCLDELIAAKTKLRKTRSGALDYMNMKIKVFESSINLNTQVTNTLV